MMKDNAKEAQLNSNAEVFKTFAQKCFTYVCVRYMSEGGWAAVHDPGAGQQSSTLRRRQSGENGAAAVSVVQRGAPTSFYDSRALP